MKQVAVQLGRLLAKSVTLALVSIMILGRPRNLRIRANLTDNDVPAAKDSESDAEGEEQSKVFSPWLRATKEMKWWFPGSLVVVATATTIALYFASRYYYGFYQAFGLTVDQVGITRTDTIIHLIPYGVLFGAVILTVRLIAVLFFKGVRLPRRVSADWAFTFRLSIVGGFLILVAVIVEFGEITAQEAGYNDAQAAIGSVHNELYASYWQQVLGIQTGKASIVQWVGPADANIFSNSPTAANSQHFSVIRILSQIDETTIYFDIIDCDVHVVPSIDLSITSAPVTYSGALPNGSSASSTSSPDLPFKSCAAR